MTKLIKCSRRILSWLYHEMVFLSFWPFSWGRLKDEKVVLSNFNGKGFSGSPKYIALALLERNYRLIWLTKDRTDMPDKIETVPYDSFRAAYHLSTARVWIDNVRKQKVRKRKNQVYIQTWHGFGMKRVEKDVESVLQDSYIKLAKRDSSICDYFISNGPMLTEIYKRAFWYNGEILEIGLPRNDVFFSDVEKITKKVKEELSILNGVKLVLYAPTFRRNLSCDCYDLNLEELRSWCQSKWGGQWAVLVRLHPNMQGQSLGWLYSDNIKNASYYPDIQELLCASDIVVSDYSSLMFDFCFLRRPCFIYATDIQEYKKDRDFYMDIESLPFPIAQRKHELKNQILNFDNCEYQKELIQFFDRFSFFEDGNASEIVANMIDDLKRK